MSWTNNEQSIIKKINKKFNLGLVEDSENYNHFDASSDKYIVEIKARKFPSNHKYALDGCFLEKYKYDHLCKKADDRKMLYINYFTDDIIAIWNLSKIKEFDWEVLRMKKQTYGYNNQVIEKVVTKLLLSSAITFRGNDV